MRRVIARRRRRKCTNCWPIDESSSQAPEGWPGWPDGKNFAFVITHDVEGPTGLAKCRKLAELEMELGFRSSFNFIPEGSYSVPSDLRAWLVERGFEIGVHDLNHDGKLFFSHEGFLKKAERINYYLKEWNACGYRSGFMLRNLRWLHNLNLLYDASTFDTDPFEPQPDGAGTIFPFWIPNRNDKLEGRNKATGYVELPYTLSQDSTLFLLLGETTPNIWLRKLDWIARHAGMALVNVHPDYVCFPGEIPKASTFSSDHYSQLLKRVRDHYPDTSWRPLPKELAAYVDTIRPLRKEKRKPRNVCIVTYSFYECDTRVFRYGETLAQAGDSVDVLAIGSSPESPREELIDGCRVFRLQDRTIKEKSRASFILPLLKFLWRASWWINRQHRRRPYDVVHIHNVPDFLVFAAWRPKVSGAAIILDIHDLVPELFASKFKAALGSATIRALKLMERFSAAFADHVILANHLWLDVYVARSARQEKCSVFINNVESRIFFPRPRTRNDDRQIIIFPGSLQWHQGVDIAILAFQKLARALPKAELHIYGEGQAKSDLMELAKQTGFHERILFHGFIPTKEIANIMANADVGIVPKRADSFGNQAYSTKIMEFMSLGVPVVVSKTEIDQYYFDDSLVRFFDSGNSDALADAIVEVLSDRNLRERLVANASRHAKLHDWTSRQGDYLRLVESLCPALHSSQ